MEEYLVLLVECTTALTLRVVFVRVGTLWYCDTQMASFLNQSKRVQIHLIQSKTFPLSQSKTTRSVSAVVNVLTKCSRPLRKQAPMIIPNHSNLENSLQDGEGMYVSLLTLDES